MSASTDNESVLEQVLALLAERAPEHAGPLEADSVLGDSVLLDSFQVLELVMALEEAFDVSFERADLQRLDTPQRIAELIVSKGPGG